jgi:hypothetical protein
MKMRTFDGREPNGMVRPFADTRDVAQFKKTAAQLGNARDIWPKRAFRPLAVARNLADWTLQNFACSRRLVKAA